MVRTPAPKPVGASRWAIPDARHADPDGVVGVGADLAPATLVEAYRRGLFPWPHEGMPLPWFSPDPRSNIPVGEVHVSRSLRRRIRSCGWRTSMDRAFRSVVQSCATGRNDGTWITPEMLAAYTRLHELGWAHSLEVWDDGVLVGGVYGVLVGGVFTGESMFHRLPDASKVALVDLCARLQEAGGQWLDVQLETPHLTSMGARSVTRDEFLRRLQTVRDDDVRPHTDLLEVARLA